MVTGASGARPGFYFGPPRRQRRRSPNRRSRQPAIPTNNNEFGSGYRGASAARPAFYFGPPRRQRRRSPKRRPRPPTTPKKQRIRIWLQGHRRLGQVSILGRHGASDAAHQIGNGGNLQYQQPKRIRIWLQVPRQRCILRFSSSLSIHR